MLFRWIQILFDKFEYFRGNSNLFQRQNIVFFLWKKQFKHFGIFFFDSFIYSFEFNSIQFNSKFQSRFESECKLQFDKIRIRVQNIEWFAPWFVIQQFKLQITNHAKRKRYHQQTFPTAFSRFIIPFHSECNSISMGAQWIKKMV